MHVGTFTRAGTWAAAAELPELAGIGVTMIEVMPVAEFEGRFGWGYDGVDLFAPMHLYGAPDDFRRFVDAAHGCGVAVILDVVYNHLGPVGNYLARSRRRTSPTGTTTSGATRSTSTVRTRAGPRVLHHQRRLLDRRVSSRRAAPRRDAADFRRSAEHIVPRCAAGAPRGGGHDRSIIVAENEPQDTRLVRPIAQGGYGLDALWNDDFHHSAMVALTGRSEAYYSRHPRRAAGVHLGGEVRLSVPGPALSLAAEAARHAGLGLPPAAFVVFLQNHDQVANSARGLRGHS